MKPKRTWLLVADAAGARVFEKLSDTPKLTEIDRLARQHDHRASHEIGSDRPGRVVESANSARHAVSPKTDPHRQLKRSFAVELAHLLEAEAGAHNFDRLIVVLPPAMLGDFRAAVSAPIKALIAAEIDKDLTKLSRDDVESHVRQLVPL